MKTATVAFELGDQSGAGHMSKKFQRPATPLAATR